MELIRGLHNIKSCHQGCVATIGNFDGVHLGHQQVIKQLQQEAEALNLPTLLITFEPYPKEFFLKEQAPARLTRLREKLKFLQNTSIDRVLCIRFNAHFARILAQDFVESILVSDLSVKALIVGDDFRFGYKRQGDFALLKQLGDRFHFKVVRVTTLNNGEQRISSSRIRKALAKGELNKAEKLLGRPYSMYGRIAHGDKRGRIIGFPTANVYLHREVTPLQGVYAVKVYGLEKKALLGVANIGNRPTLGGGRTVLEVHIFHFNKNVYGHYVGVEFLHKLRDEKKFDNFELLKAQIIKDAKEAKAFFNII